MDKIIRFEGDDAPEYEKLLAQEDLILEVTEAIWKELDNRSWTKAQLAEALECSPAHVTQLLNGARNMTLRTLADIASAFGLHAKFKLLNDADLRAWQKGEARVSHISACTSRNFTNIKHANDEWYEITAA